MRLAQFGCSVATIEKQAFPRPHVGESLVGDVLPLLEVLGLRPDMEEAGFLRTAGALVKWAGAMEYRENLGLPGFQVHRGRFDEILLQGARKAGALVLQPARVTGMTRNGQGGWSLGVQNATRSWNLRARFLACATGRAGLPGGIRRRTSPPTLAVYAYWRLGQLGRSGAVTGAETRIEAGGNEWFWGAPLPCREFIASVFIDPSRYASGVARAGGLPGFYREMLAASTLLADCLSGASCGAVRVCDAGGIQDEIPATPDTIRVGEASFSIDPLSSQGVQTALGSALHAAAVVRTILQRPEATSLALEFYRARQSESVALHARAARRFYAEVARLRPAEFWQRRAAPAVGVADDEIPSRAWKDFDGSTKIRLSPHVQITTMPILKDDFIVPAQALIAPGLPRPVAYLGGIAVAPLVAMVQPSVSAEHLLDCWSRQVSETQAWEIFRWLWTAGILRA